VPSVKKEGSEANGEKFFGLGQPTTTIGRFRRGGDNKDSIEGSELNGKRKIVSRHSVYQGGRRIDCTHWAGGNNRRVPGTVGLAAIGA